MLIFTPKCSLFLLLAEVDKKSKKMRDAEKFDVPVVSEDYLDAVKKGGAILMISQHSISSWGSKKVGFKTCKVLCVLRMCELRLATSLPHELHRRKSGKNEQANFFRP